MMICILREFEDVWVLAARTPVTGLTHEHINAQALTVIAALSSVIPALSSVIPAKAGIHHYQPLK